MSVNVDANIGAEQDLYGKVVSDLQQSIVVSADGVSGTLKYVTDYSEAFGYGEDSGNYLAIHCTTPGVEDAEIDVTSSDEGTVVFDADTGIAICRITDKDTQTIEVVAYKDGESDSVTLDLSNLTLQEGPALSVLADVSIDPDEDLFGKVVSDLQENIVVGDGSVTGTLKYISDYSSAYGSGEDSGYYLVLHCTTPGVTGAVITSEVVNGVHGPVTLDEDGIIISRIANKDTQSIQIVATKDGETDTVTLDLSGLTLEEP